MPQLNPSPWFLIMIFSWMVFLTIIPPKVLAHSFSNEPAPLNTESSKTEPWAWPWH
uniref:ATP synthase complex subunit 8 n=1 Tax=Mikrogeophagus ramirezi TaxID=284740 RepID=A0A1C8DX07_9CICH|nr:ATP synthase F0 subunit 8 [Mikrogeophagus ramirezi]ALF63209.1 ATP synthase F0 subunit 8 [Mikrogeophagus ramirezi]